MGVVPGEMLVEVLREVSSLGGVITEGIIP